MTWLTWTLLIGYILLSVALYKIFEKAGEDPKKALIHGYNMWIVAKLVGRKPSYSLLLLIPFVNIFIFAALMVDLARSFGRFGFLESVAAVLASHAYFGWLGFRDDVTYHGPILEKERAYRAKLAAAHKAGDKREINKIERENPFAKPVVREWGEAAIFAIFAAAFIRLLLIEAYVIPTPSMEGSLLVGDFLFVSKAHYGIRLPETVFMLPLVHNRAPIVGGESYLKEPSLPYRRLPALEKLKRNVPIVFNVPSGDSVYIFPDRTWAASDYSSGILDGSPYERSIKTGQVKLVTRPLDKKDHYIKRLIGMPGDSLQIIDRQVYINGEPGKNPENMQFLYTVEFSETPRLEAFADDGIAADDVRQLGDKTYAIFLSEDQRALLQRADPAAKIENYNFAPRSTAPTLQLFPHDTKYFGKWTVDNFGPIWIPKKGATIDLTPANIVFYRRAITAYEGNDLQVVDGKAVINGQPADTYTFQMDYYWMMGDNRHNSEDSRVWGYVPEDHILGKPLVIMFSLKEGSLAKGVNWNRIFKSANK